MLPAHSRTGNPSPRCRFMCNPLSLHQPRYTRSSVISAMPRTRHPPAPSPTHRKSFALQEPQRIGETGQ